MNDFIKGIVDFIISIYDGLVYSFTSNSLISEFNTFMSKNILNGTLINVDLTYKELFLFVGSVIVVILFILLFVNFIKSLLHFINFK